MNKKQKSNLYFVWNLVPIFILFIVTAVLITWQITYNYVREDVLSKTAKIVEYNSEQIKEIADHDYDIVSNELAAKVSEVDRTIRSKYYYEIDEKELLDFTLIGYTAGLNDKYAKYYTEEELKEYYKTDVEGKKTGLGVTCAYSEEQGGLLLLSIYKNAPAYLVGLSINEVITHIDSKSVIEMGYSASLNEIASKGVGDTVSLTVKSTEGTSREVTVVVAEFDVETVSYRLVMPDVGLIKINEFAGNTSKEFTNAIEELSEMGVDKFIFDVRHNHGGFLDSIVEILDFLLPEGKIITVKYKNGTEKTIMSESNSWASPMVVLVDGETASAAELFTAALRDYDKAEIVGETTFGKGSMQSVEDNIPGGGAISFTVGMYYPPNGKSYDGIGIVPDYEIALPKDVSEHFSTMTDEEDVQLQKAIEIISQMQTTVVQ